MFSTVDLARRAIAAAASVRVEHRLDPYQSICIYDLVERFGMELRFVAAPSLEGIYSAGELPIIALSSLRTSGRQRFTCAHELGHHVFAHGTHIDEFNSQDRKRRFEPREFIVDCFADFLLMPKLAVVSSLRARNLDVNEATPLQLFTLAHYFGVGYRTIVHHLSKNLLLLDAQRAKALGRVRPQVIRNFLVPTHATQEVFVADNHWVGRPIDLHVGDFLIVPEGTFCDSDLLEEVSSDRERLYQARRPGRCRVAEAQSSWASYVRIAARIPPGNFVGRSIYRHEPEA